MKWDIFISHANEDKMSVALPLSFRLQEARLKVWLDVLELQIGDSLQERINEGIAQSRFSIIILSPDFFRKKWATSELNGIFAREIEGMTSILPIWHRIALSDVSSRYPILADRMAVSTDIGIDAVASRVIDVATKCKKLSRLRDARIALAKLQTDMKQTDDRFAGYIAEANLNPDDPMGYAAYNHESDLASYMVDKLRQEKLLQAEVKQLEEECGPYAIQ